MICSSVRGFRTYTRLRDSSAEMISNDGFSVVAPIKRMLPFSTWGKNASCCALLKRWISSMKTMVRVPYCAGALGVGHDLLDFLDSGEHGGELDELRFGHARDNLRQRGLARARRAPENHRADVVALDLHPQRLAGTNQVFLADKFVEGARDACGRRAGACGRRSCRDAEWLEKGPYTFMVA